MANPFDDQSPWFKVADSDEWPEGRVETVSAGLQTLALTHFKGQFSCLHNKCP